MKLHYNVLNISFVHRHQIKTVFTDILGLDGIEHFSLDLVDPNGEMLFFSGTPQHAFEICRRGLAKYDGIISPNYYQNNEFYWWNDAIHKAYAAKINAIREGYLGLRNGFMLVRNWNNFYLVYSFATRKSDPDFQSQMTNKINKFLQMGDYAYSQMRETYASYSKCEPPIIEKFFNFQGGRPPSRYTKNFIVSEHEKNITDNLIQYDFKLKKIVF